MRLVFMGTPQAAVPTLERLLADGHEVAAVYTQPDRPAGRGQKLTAPPVKQLALDRGLDVRQPSKIKTEEAFDEFSSFKADAAIVVAYGRILPDRWLAAFARGAINVHFSLLPKYRGAAPVNWAIANGETETGVTTMQMDVGLDTGDILLQRKVSISPDEYAVELMDRLAVSGAELLAETLSSFNSITPKPQENALATFAPIMRKEDGRIDWSRSAKEIADRVRGFQPFPSSFSFHLNKRYTIWRCEPVSADHDTEPGFVYGAWGEVLEIECGERSMLRVLEIQPEGKRRMPVRDFLNGGMISAGDKFGI